jgi:6-phosphogluconolactonase
MEIRTFQSAQEVAKEAAVFIADRIRENIDKKDYFTWAISGGRTPWEMIKELATEDLPWEKVFLFQVDERMAPDAHEDRNLTQLFKSIAGTPLITRLNIFPMKANSDDPNAACSDYSETILRITKTGKFDLIHLGIGTDGHTASLIPGDPVLEIEDRSVAITSNTYQGRNRMTLTFPIINQAERILWLVTGEEKAEMLDRMLQADLTIPAGRISQAHAIVMTEQAVAKSANI